MLHQLQRSRSRPVYTVRVSSTNFCRPITNRQRWLLAIGLIAVDLTFFMVPIVPFLAAYVLLVRPPWFREFVDDLYDRR